MASGSDEHANPGDDAREAAVAGQAAGGAEPDSVAAAAAELYGADAEAFTDRRKALAAAAKAAGDKSAATAIAALRKPTRAAWVVNRLARADPGIPPRLAALAAALRAAERATDGARLRELSQARGSLTDALTEQALAAAGFPDPPPSLRAEVSATLTAALADPDVAAAFAAGTLDRAAHWSGFGAADVTTGDGDPVFPGDAPGAAFPGGAPGAADTAPGPPDPIADGGAGVMAEGVAPPPSPAPRPAGARTRPRSPARRAGSGPVAERDAKAEEQQLAQAAAERAARHRKAFADAERAVACAALAAAAAIAGEDQLEADVRGLEERLTRARPELIAARLTARRAEAAERRARQVLDRLGGG